MWCAADGDLILGLVGEDVLADARGGLDVVVGVVDVDESAPMVDEFLVADHPPEPPDGRLFNGKHFGSKCWLRVGGDQVEAGLTVSCSAKALTRCRIVNTPSLI